MENDLKKRIVKHKIKFWIILSVILVIISLLVYPLLISDKIHCEVQLVVDGKVCELDESNFTLERTPPNEPEGKIRMIDANTAKISFHAHEYGGYTFKINNIKEFPSEEPIVFHIHQSRGELSKKIKMQIKIDTASHTIVFYGTDTVSDSSINWTSDYLKDGLRSGIGP